jgi:hypothetical protein|nr:MAG TPA: hypothetical protein [Caudoviricetes sp.]
MKLLVYRMALSALSHEIASVQKPNEADEPHPKAIVASISSLHVA